jgi:hypothetical protein
MAVFETATTVKTPLYGEEWFDFFFLGGIHGLMWTTIGAIYYI